MTGSASVRIKAGLCVFSGLNSLLDYSLLELNGKKNLYINIRFFNPVS
jgi:hypothetical protein